MNTPYPAAAAVMNAPRPCGVRIAPPTLRLAANAVRAFDGATTVLVRCVGGSVWVTQEGNSGDVVLSAGEQFVPARSGKIVVQSLGEAPAHLEALQCRA